MRAVYYAVVIVGYIAILAMILWVLAAPNSWRIVSLIVSAIGVGVPLYFTREPFPKWTPEASEAWQDDYDN